MEKKQQVDRDMKDSTQLAVDAAVVSGANKATAGGAATTVFGWVSQSDLIGVAGLLLAVSGFAVSLYFQFRRERREIELHRARMSAISEAQSNEP